ncbi:PspC family transcriptional regulator [Crocinitomix algicola]|uniref:PspC family transcriptional regulator n=1 Tax=Crocinitomix algicola TaxID=1740263 RepID=UPI0009F6162E|nr:PspC family transcriptional regulator [Crocinitomix algicola]
MIQKIALFFELRSFGVSTWFARKMRVDVSRVRLFFIYSSFIALGSPIVIYMIMAFVLEHKHIFKLQRRRKSIWEL